MNKFQKLNRILANMNIKDSNFYTKEDFERLYKAWKKQNRKASIKTIQRMIAFRK